MTAWTEFEDDQIRSGAAAGLTMADVAAQLGRGRTDVAGRARRIGVKYPLTHAKRERMFTPANAAELGRRGGKATAANV